MRSEQNPTLLDFSPSFANEVRAFSTTRIAPADFLSGDNDGISRQDENGLSGNDYPPSTDDNALPRDAYAAFNVTHYCGDDASHVARCRQWLCAQLGISERHFVLPRQTHTTNVLAIDDGFATKDDAERAALLNEVDALITDAPGLCIGVSTADCVPVLLYAVGRRAVAAVHAGWRGTVGRIVEKAAGEMIARYGVSPADMRAVIGPSISQQAFETGEEVVEAFGAAGFPLNQIMKRTSPGGKAHIDLWAANYLQLAEVGVSLENIHVTGLCTYANHERFFSARRLGIHSGRIFSGIML